MYNCGPSKCVRGLAEAALFRDSRRRRPRALLRDISLLVVATTVISAIDARADEWVVTPRVSLYQSYTSNAELAPDGQGSSDFFSTLIPAIGIRGTTPRVKLDLDYSLAAIAYAENSNLDQIRNNLNFNSTLTLVPELLFVDGLASVQQVPVNDGAPASSSPFAASTNLDTVAVYSISPFVKNHLGTFADTELRYTFNQVYSSGGELSNQTTNRVTITAVSGSQFTRLLWTVVADGENSTFGGASPDTFSRLVQGSGEYRLNREFGLLGSAGFEQISDPTFSPDPEPDGPIGSVGVKYTPSARTSVVLQLNHRYDSNFVSGSANYLIGPQTQIRAAYNEQVVTSSQSLFSNNLSFLTTDEFGNFIDARTERLFSLSNNPFGLENTAFRERTFDVGFRAVRGRNTFNAGAFWQDRNVFQTSETDTAFGGSLSWSRALTPSLNMNLTARYTNEQFDLGSSDNNQEVIGLGGSLEYQLNDTLEGILGVNFARQLADIPVNQYSETIFSLGLQKRF